jgi:peptidoglycan/LPS O-acetylase OafA/YrhL
MTDESRLRFSYRPALDGLRAIAVIAVIVYHLNSEWLPGGYLGVDLFFVLSGFLITSLLLIERDTTGRLDLGKFWTRRIRRLLPASLVVLLTVIVVMAIYGNIVEQAARRGEALSALAYVTNWQFILSGQSYFEGFIGVSPLRHYWSLAIEEQFYFLWPLSLYIALRFRARRWLWGVAAFIVIASGFLMAVVYSPANASRSYFGTDTRIHQILIGCLLAALFRSQMNQQLTSTLRRILPIATAGLLVAFLTLDATSPAYYMGGAVFFALLVAVMILGLESDSAIRRVLSWRPIVWIGTISYGLYLWHWPLIQWVNADTVGYDGVLLDVTRVAATLIAATASYYLLEQPIRRGRIGIFDVNRRTLKRQVPVLTGATALLILLLLGSSSLPEWMQEPALAGPATTLASETIPGSVASVVEEPPVTVAVVGDSVMVSMLPGVRELASKNNWNLVESAVRACPVGYEPLYDYDGTISPFFETSCREAVPEAHRRVRNARTEVVIWHDLQSALGRRDGDELLDPGSDLWAQDLVSEWLHAVNMFGPTVEHLFVISPPLRSQDGIGCEESARIARCRTIQRQDSDIRTALDLFAGLYEGEPKLHLIDLDHLVCPRGNPCPSMIDGVVVRLEDNDQTHFTEEGSTWLMARLVHEFAARVPELLLDSEQD